MQLDAGASLADARVYERRRAFAAVGKRRPYSVSFGVSGYHS